VERYWRAGWRPKRVSGQQTEIYRLHLSKQRRKLLDPDLLRGRLVEKEFPFPFLLVAAAAKVDSRIEMHE
jgi:hypothetical protein